MHYTEKERLNNKVEIYIQEQDENNIIGTLKETRA